jgi:PASTA domain-containing protein
MKEKVLFVGCAAAAVGGFLVAFAAFPPASSAHQNGCHAAHSCPSDHHTYVWTDPNTNLGWDCAKPDAGEYDPSRDTTTIIWYGYTYKCRAAGSTTTTATTTTATTTTATTTTATTTTGTSATTTTTGTGTTSTAATTIAAPTTTTTTTDPGATTAPARCVVPNVRNKLLAKAQGALRRAHCRSGRISHAKSSTVRRGRVIFQRPKPGKRIASGGRINLVVSRGTTHS